MDALLTGVLAQGFIPHGHCYLWTPSLVWLHVGSDALIGLAYLLIPVGLVQVVRQREDLPFSWIFVMFGLFIVACGATHLVEIWNVWHSDYWVSGGVKFVTAAASIPTAYFLFRLLPRIRTIPSHEELRQANSRLQGAIREVEQFSYAVSHDLRAPLRSMQGFSHALMSQYAGQLDEQAEHYLERIQEGSRRMANLMDDLLALSRIQREEVAREPVDITALADEVVRELHSGSPGRNVETDIEPGLVLTGDRNLLYIALSNLVGNAWKFTRDRDPARIEIGSRTVDGRRVVYVRDNGVGFDMAHAGKLFVPFQRLHRDKDIPGTGIGLATVQRIVQKHGGEVWAESEIGQGATFFFYTS